MQRSRFAITRPALFSLLGAVALLFLAIAAIVSSGSASQASVPTEITPRSGTDNTVLGSWTAMGVKNRTGDDSFQDPGLNQAVYALVEYQGDIYAGGLFDDTGGGGNNEADCSDDADYPLQCIAKWDPATNAWTPVGDGLNNQVDAFAEMDGTLYVGGLFDDTMGGPGVGRCNPSAGIAWTPRTAPTKPWSSVTWGANRFVAVASAGDDTRVMYSDNGADWSTPTVSVPVNDWKSVTWGGERFVAVAPSSDESQVMSSSNGTNWTAHNAASDDSWTSVAYGGGKFVAVASSGDDTRAMYSTPDGSSWTLASSGVAANAWSSVAYGNGKFVAVASSGDDTRVMYSTNGVSWSRPTTRVPVNDWQSVAWGNNKFVAVASNGDDTQVMTSEDGIQWSSRAGSADEDSWSSVTWAGDMFVAVASAGTHGRLMFSTNSVSWSTRTSGTVYPYSWQSVARGDFGETDAAYDDTVVAVARDGTYRVMTSVATPSPGALRCISAWNGSSWTPLGTGLDGGATALAALGDDTLIIGGGFGLAGPLGSADNPLSGIAGWSDNTWIQAGVGGFDTAINSLLTDGLSTAYAGGSQQGEYPTYDDSGITRMVGPFDDASAWSPVSTGFSWTRSTDSSVQPGRVDALAQVDNTVYAGGYFMSTGNDQSDLLHNLASWNGVSWNTVGAGLNGDDAGTTSVRALASDDTRGLLYVGGTFDNVYGGVGNGICDDTDIAVGPLRCVTVWDEGIDEFLPFQWGSNDDSNGLTGEVKAFVVDGPDVYVGGQFNTWPEGGFPQVWNLKNVGKWTWLPPTGSVNASAATGQTVAITGTRFIGVPSDGVKFGTTAVPFTRSSTESITATVPSSLASGTYTISVNGVGGWADVGTVTVSRRSGGDSTAPPVLPVPTPTPSASPSPSATPKPTGPSIAELRAVGEVRPGSVRALAKGVPPGRSIVVVDGRKTKSDLTIGQRRMVVRTGPITLALRTKSAEGRNQRVDDGSLSIPRATRLNRDRAAALPSITMVSNGYAALTPVRVFLIPQPDGGPRGMRAKDLGYLMTNSQGQLRGKLPIRVRKVGSYIVQVNGKGPDGLVRSINLPAVVERRR